MVWVFWIIVIVLGACLAKGLADNGPAGLIPADMATNSSKAAAVLFGYIMRLCTICLTFPLRWLGRFLRPRKKSNGS